MSGTYRPLPWNRVTVQSAALKQRMERNRNYLLSLKTANLLQNHYQEAGLWNPPHQPEDCHWGWESPTCQLRGHFLGHWLSAAARSFATTGDPELKGKADFIVSELARCQRENGGEWIGSIPEKYLDWIARGRKVWAPHYTLHKTLMGLYDMYEFGQNKQALEVLDNWASWFHRWTGQFSREKLDDILDVETGGMLEVWANLYGVTGKPEHLELIQRYTRQRLFDRLLKGEDVLTNMHANTTIPEIHGAARAWEVTGDQRWRDIVEAYWRIAVTDRGYFCTGGQTGDEMWTPPHELAGRLGPYTQEFCTVYNLMRLAGWLFRWTGDVAYADYYERNFYNGVLAQQNPNTGMVAYYLSLEAGATKHWGSPTNDFWCCHGTIVQAYANQGSDIYFETDAGLVVSQYIPSRLEWEYNGASVTITQDTRVPGVYALSKQQGQWRDAKAFEYTCDIQCSQPTEFELKLRLPWWLAGEPTITINGERLNVPYAPSSLFSVRRRWQNDQLTIKLPKELRSVPLPGDPDTVAFMDGPVVLAGLSDEAPTLYGDRAQPETILTPHNVRPWDKLWQSAYQTRQQPHSTRFLPLYDVCDEHYTVYFPVRERE
jgi:DUF1680 family protein